MSSPKRKSPAELAGTRGGNEREGFNAGENLTESWAERKANPQPVGLWDLGPPPLRNGQRCQQAFYPQAPLDVICEVCAEWSGGVE
jgi:hypothetical protein